MNFFDEVLKATYKKYIRYKNYTYSYEGQVKKKKFSIHMRNPLFKYLCQKTRSQPTKSQRKKKKMKNKKKISCHGN